MAQGLMAFRKIQIGKETTRGTAVAATEKMTGALTMQDTRVIETPEVESGGLSKLVDGMAFQAGLGAQMEFTGPASYERMIQWLEMGVKGGVTGAVQTSLAYLWTYKPSVTADPAQSAYTFEYGDDLQAYEAEYCMPSELELTGAPDQSLQFKASLFGRQVSEVSFTGSLTFPTFTPIKFNQAKVYVDGTWANLGTTELANSLLGFTWKLPTGLAPFKAADGNDYFATHVQGKRQMELELFLAFNTAVSGEMSKFRDQSTRAVRLQFTGALIETGHNFQLTLDMLGVMVDWSPLGEHDGGDAVTVKLVSSGDVDNDNEFQVLVKNKETGL